MYSILYDSWKCDHWNVNLLLLLLLLLLLRNYNKSAVNYFPLHIHLMWITSSTAHWNKKKPAKNQIKPKTQKSPPGWVLKKTRVFWTLQQLQLNSSKMVYFTAVYGITRFNDCEVECVQLLFTCLLIMDCKCRFVD